MSLWNLPFNKYWEFSVAAAATLLLSPIIVSPDYVEKLLVEKYY